jgi:general secretion pathway protein L
MGSFNRTKGTVRYREVWSLLAGDRADHWAKRTLVAMKLLGAMPSELPFRDVAARYFRWWWEQLRELLPDRILAVNADADAHLIIEVDGEELVCYVIRANDRQRIGRIPDSTAAPADREAFMAGIRDHLPHSTAACLVLPRSQVLRQLVPLPLAARDNLSEVLGYEMDRQTPFRADQVYYDYQIAECVSDSDELAVELIAAPRRTVDVLLDRIASFGIVLDRVEVASTQVGSLPTGNRAINLLPPGSRGGRKRRLSSTNIRLLGGTVVLLVIALALPIIKIKRAEGQLEAEIANIEPHAEQVIDLHERLQHRVEATDSLLRLRESSPIVIEVLAELARILPDHTWLSTLELRNGVLQIRGHSATSSELISLIEGSSAFRGVSFASPVTQDERTGKERFEIRAQLAASGSSQ